ncbi:MAG: zf-TFIIB domain-containing protein [Clostridia bacterium]|nr:zf-TFIIB domain-containing protein [Clostridia bacterium]
MRFRDRLVRFMYGRYGADELYKFLTVLFYILFIINIFLRSAVMSALILVLLAYATFRVFSRNIYRRRAENEKYLKIKSSVKGFFKLRRDKWRDRNTHVYKKCPKCRATLRFPKKKGIHTARCPKCGESFQVKV